LVRLEAANAERKSAVNQHAYEDCGHEDTNENPEWEQPRMRGLAVTRAYLDWGTRSWIAIVLREQTDEAIGTFPSLAQWPGHTGHFCGQPR
jgi:hypothetical protein